MSLITRRNIVRHELIRLHAEVVRSPYPGYLGIRGRIIDETKNALLILGGDRKKGVPKSVVVLHITLPDGSTVEVDGKWVVDRVKKRVRRKGGNA